MERILYFNANYKTENKHLIFLTIDSYSKEIDENDIVKLY